MSIGVIRVHGRRWTENWSHTLMTISRLTTHSMKCQEHPQGTLDKSHQAHPQVTLDKSPTTMGNTKHTHKAH